MRVRAMVVATGDTGRIIESVTVELPEFKDAEWYASGDADTDVHREIRRRIAALRPGELVGYALLPAADESRDDAVRTLALMHLDDDRMLTATKIAEWPDAAKELILVLAAAAGE